MTEPITNNYDEMTGGAARVQSDLSTPSPASRPAAGVDPRLTAAVDDAAAQNRRGRDKVRDGAERTGNYTKGMSALQEEGGRNVRGAGGPQMPAMPTVPASAAPAPQPAYAPAPLAAPASMPAPSIPAPPPPGVTSISPALLAALVAATQERVQADAAAGVVPGLAGDAASPRSASTPQAPQPLHPSQVSLERYPGGQLSREQTAAVIDQALTINGVPNDPNLRAQWQQLYQHMAEGESARNPNAVNTHDCVPLDYMILTRSGWLKHDEVRVGDKTIGYNPVTGKSEWTAITAVVHHENAPLVRLFNSRWHATITENHRWLVSERSYEVHTAASSSNAGSCHLCSWPHGYVRRPGFSATNGLNIHLAKMHGLRATRSDGHTALRMVATRDLNSRHTMILSAAADTGNGFEITDTEAELLGWIACDGHVEKHKDVPRGRKKPTISIAQSKPDMVCRLQELLKDIPHADYVDERLTRLGRMPCGPRHQFRLHHEWSSDLLRRVGHPKEDAVAIVLNMSSRQRALWLKGIIAAEGHIDPLGRAIISQCFGEVLNAIEIAIYLSGRRPRVRDNKVNTPGWSPSASVTGNIPRLTTDKRSLLKEAVGSGPVWCVTTDLGSWTCRNSQHVFLTGNSNATGARQADGAPANSSRGMWQCIPTTFAAYHMAGTSTSIYDPVASAAASINYVMNRYHVAPTGEGLAAFAAARGVGRGTYTGY